MAKEAEITFKVVVEKDEDGFLVADVPALEGCHTQAKNMKELLKRLREVISLCLEDEVPVRKDVFVREISVPKHQAKSLNA